MYFLTVLMIFKISYSTHPMLPLFFLSDSDESFDEAAVNSKIQCQTREVLFVGSPKHKYSPVPCVDCNPFAKTVVYKSIKESENNDEDSKSKETPNEKGAFISGLSRLCNCGNQSGRGIDDEEDEVIVFETLEAGGYRKKDRLDLNKDDDKQCDENKENEDEEDCF
ncbi:hypothetical protein SLOPH_458 [Spraguea lophii 42_110]|uniref:Uncharacterized protein n=1 Tax=Spraguea lophii (strain 42_110) TaxID=1358809 RepID=S7XVK8_SPRLO|nr:hypothetical protein SLOPH_458 [Spraguea lophii 42_110]